MPDKQNEALWCHLMMGGTVWQEVLKHREEEEGRIVQVFSSSREVFTNIVSRELRFNHFITLFPG